MAHLEGDAGSEEAVRLGDNVGLEVGGDRQVEAGVDLYVERVAARERIGRRHVERHRAEHAELVQLREGAVLRIDREGLPGFERQGACEQARADLHRALRDDRGTLQAERVRRARRDVRQPYRHAPRAVGAQHLGRGGGLQLQADVGPASAHGRVGQELEVLRPEIVVAPVAEDAGDAVALPGERVEVVLCSGAERGGGPQAVDQRGETPRSGRVFDRAVAVGRGDAQRVVHFGLEPPLAVTELVRDFGAEVAVVGERLFGDLGAQVGADLRDEHGLLGQPLVEPVFEAPLPGCVEVVVGPQPDGQRGAHEGAVERVVRSDREGLPGCRGCGIGERDPRVGLDADLPDPGVEHLALAEPPGRGAGRAEEECAEHERAAYVSACRIHGGCVFSRCGRPTGRGRAGGPSSYG